MPTLEHIRLAPNRRDLYVLEFDDGNKIKGTVALIADFALSEGLSLSPERYQALRDAAERARTKRRAANILSARALSARELYDRLLEKGESAPNAAEAVARMVEIGAVDDATYACSIVRHYSARGYGVSRIKNELYRHKVGREHWDEALAALPEDNGAIDRLLAAKLRGARPEGRELKRATDALARRGFTWDEIRSAVRRYEDTMEEEVQWDIE